MDNFGNNYPNNSINKNNTKNILSLIDCPILIDIHEHPLFYCYTTGRGNSSSSWFCNKCGNGYTYNVPTFYCTFCDFDLCENCAGNYNSNQILIYDYEDNVLNNTLLKNPPGFQNWQKVFPSHNHFLTMVRKRNKDINKKKSWICEFCSRPYSSKEDFYYCSLCDYYLCQYCSNEQMINMEELKIQKQNIIKSEDNLNLSRSASTSLTFIKDGKESTYNFENGETVYDAFEKFGGPSWKDKYYFLYKGNMVPLEKDEKLENLFKEKNNKILVNESIF
jgi:hypothetical protein